MDHLQKNLLTIDSSLPAFKNNAKVLAALQEFITNPNVNTVCLNCDKPLLLQAFVEYLKKTAKFTFTHLDAHGIENIDDSIRKAVVLCVKTSRDVYEGELINVYQNRDESGTIQSIEVTLKTQKSTKKILLTKNLINLVNDVNIGDVVYIEPNSGILKRLGRSETRANEYDLEGDKQIPLLKNQVHTTREKDTYITLYDLDYAYNKYSENITDFTRRKVDEIVEDYLTRGLAQLVCSGVFIENSKYLNDFNSYRLAQLTQLFPHLKIILDGCNSELLEDSFLFINSVNDENAMEILEYFLKKPIPEEMKDVLEKNLNYGNYEKILSFLSIANTREELTNLIYLEN